MHCAWTQTVSNFKMQQTVSDNVIEFLELSRD